MKYFFALLLLFSSSFCSITDIQTAATLLRDGHSQLVIDAEFNESEGKNVFLSFSQPLQNVEITDRSGLSVPFQIIKNNGNYLVNFTVPYDYVNIKLQSDSFTTKNGSIWIFNLAIGSSEHIQTSFISLKLPEGAVLHSTSGGTVSSSNSLFLIWNYKNVPAFTQARFSASYTLEPVATDYSILFIVFIALVIFLLYFKSRTTPKQNVPPLQDTLLKPLDQTEREIVLEIRKLGGKTTQAQLYLNTHIPKATLSRRLASLESKGILLKSQKGNRNLLTLSKEYN